MAKIDKCYKKGNKVFFTSDTHFNHTSIIKFCERPFADVEEMNEKLIENWNNKVTKDSVVFHLGDFAFGGSEVWTELLKRLNGEIFLIEGNHDRRQSGADRYKLFAGVYRQLLIKVEDTLFLLNHYPFLCYGSRERGVINLFGHVHTSLNNSGLDAPRLQYLYPTQYDVGVDNNNFTPISFSEIKNIIEQQKEKL